MELKPLLPSRLFDSMERSGISTKNQIISLSIWDIKKQTRLSIDDILLAKRIVSESVRPSIVSCNTQMEENAAHTRLSTGCNFIDNVLKGGLRRGTITEVFGESGCGKTQLALQIALNNWVCGSIYICTEGLFPTKRFQEMKRHLPNFNRKIDYGKNIFVKHITEAPDLRSSICVRLPKLLAQNNLSIVIIDSIAAPFRCESTNYIKRAEDLREIAVLLTSLAQKHNLAILCINQVTASFNDTSNVLPSLGLAWSNVVTTRLRLRKTTKLTDIHNQTPNQKYYVRDLTVVFAPDLPNATVEFVVTSRGVEALKTL